MDLDWTPEQEMLRETLRALLAEQCPPAVVRAMEDDASGFPPELWKQLAELGLAGLLIPEAHGGGGQGPLEGVILHEELGRVLAPVPHLPSAVLAAGAIQAGGSDAQRAEWLPRLASGEAILAPAWLEPEGGYGPRGIEARAEAAGAGFRLGGSKRHVPFARAATRLLVLARTGDAETAVDLFLVEPDAAGVELVQERSLGGDCQYRVELCDVALPAEARIGGAASGWASWEAAMGDACLLAAAQAVGGAERALELTVQYAKDRHQFGKPLGAFQAIAHYLADAQTRVDGARTLVWEAAWARAGGRASGQQLVPMAKLFACRTFRDLTAMAQQVFGGVGFTVEYDIQLYFRRAKQLQLSWWDERALEERIAAAVLDAA
jgi:alkylation response protein AidB-like acyl-CoA dehydrogenase